MGGLVRFLRAPFGAVGLAIALLASGPAAGLASETASYSFTQANDGITGNNTVSSPYAEVTVTANTATGEVTFDLHLANSNPAKFGSFGFNSSVSTSDFTLESINHSQYDLTGSGQLDGFGTFLQVVDAQNNNQENRVDSLVFTLQFNTGLFGEATLANFVVANDGGYFFAAEYFPNSGGTGFIAVNDDDEGSTEVVPEPSTIAMALTGIFGLGLTRLRRLRKKEAVTL